MNSKMGFGIVGSLIFFVVAIIIIGTMFPILWPIATATTTNVTAMTGTDAGTTTFKAFWPVVMLLGGLGIAVGVIIFALKKFKIM